MLPEPANFSVVLCDKVPTSVGAKGFGLQACCAQVFRLILSQLSQTISFSMNLRKRFFHPLNLFAFCAEACLLILPDFFIMRLFRAMYFRPPRPRTEKKGTAS